MRRRDIIIFLSVVLSIYSLANIFLYLKGYRALAPYLPGWLYFAIYLALASLFVFGKSFERRSSSVIVDILNVAGGFWLAFMLYATLFLLVTDLLFLVVRIVLPSAISPDFNRHLFVFMIAIPAAVLVIIAGFINSILPVKRRYTIKLNGKALPTGGVRIFAVSDIHLGSVIRRRSMRVLSRMIASERPHIVLFLGDIVDGEINPVLRDDLLASLRMPGGVSAYAIPGNHEFIGGAERTLKYIGEKGIEVLSDRVVEDSATGLQLVGRRDSDSVRYSNQSRSNLESLLEQCSPGKPVIVMDHQPVKRGREAEGGYDLMLSGHTHNGQLWPFSYLVRMVFNHSYGYYMENGSHHIVSSGFGTWGPRVRIGSRAEVLVIDLEGSDRSIS